MDLAEPLLVPKVARPSAGEPESEGSVQVAPRRRGPLRPVALVSARRRIETGMVERAFGVLDAAAVILVALAALSIRGPILQRTLGEALAVTAGSLVALALLRAARLYAFPPREQLNLHLAKTAVVVLIASSAALAADLFAPEGRTIASAWMGGLSLALLATHAFAWARVEAWRKAGRLTPNVVVVGATDNARRLIEAALKAGDIAVMGVFDDRAARAPETVGGVPVLGNTQALLSYPLLPYVDRIVITVPPSAQARVRALIDRLRVLPNPVTLFLDSDAPEARAATLQRLANAPVAHVSGADRDEQRALAKRVQDLVIASAALVVAAPVMAAIALLIKLDSPGPVLFRQRRHGFNNETILVWKFRSMRVEATDATAARQVSRDDDRVTRVGKVIRKLSLDELPQLVNVLKGEMSLVGPRPHAIGMKTAGEDSARLVAEYAWRHRMKPGITGWAQINGSVGAVDTPEAVRRRVALDIEYIERQSFAFDLYILVMTIPALIAARNVVR